MVKRSEKTFILFRFQANKAKKHLFRFALERNEKIESETKRKYAVLISLWSEPKNSKRKEAKKKKTK
jgi:hypothetical protein